MDLGNIMDTIEQNEHVEEDTKKKIAMAFTKLQNKVNFELKLGTNIQCRHNSQMNRY